LLEQRGQPERAREGLRVVCGQYSDGLDSLELIEAKSLLSNLS